MNAAKLMIKALENEGVKYIFGVPGEENEDFLFAMEDSKIQFIPVRHEQGGAFMADVWGRITGDAGVCLSTLGPGATNLMTGIADANLDKSPLVAITGQGSNDRLHHESHQVIDVVKMMEPITKWNTSVQSVDVIPEVVRKAFKIAQREKPGATHIELPENIAGMKVNGDNSILEVHKVRRPSPDQQAIALAAKLLKESKRPLIVAGNGAIRNRASKALTDFAKDTGIPVASTFMGKGAISDKSHLSLGTVGLGFKDYVIEAFEKSDLIISIGYDIAEYNPENWNPDNDNIIVHIDFNPAEVYTHYNPNVEIVADIAESVRQLHQAVAGKTWNNYFEDIKSRIDKSIASYRRSESDTTFDVPSVLWAVRDVLPDDGLVISDVGSHKMWIARNFQTHTPNGCLISNGLASMAIALPGGIAASMVDPDRSVVAIMGDGGAMMNIQELETAKRLDVGCTFIILNDNNYGLIEWKQEMNEGKSFGTRLTNPDFVKLAESFEISGYKPSSIGDLKKILNHTLTNKELSVIEIPITTEVNQYLIDELKEYFS